MACNWFAVVVFFFSSSSVLVFIHSPWRITDSGVHFDVERIRSGDLLQCGRRCGDPAQELEPRAAKGCVTGKESSQAHGARGSKLEGPTDSDFQAPATWSPREEFPIYTLGLTRSNRTPLIWRRTIG